MLLLVPAGYVQWHWLGRLAEAERDSLRRQLQTAADNFAREFDQEIGRAQTLFAGGRLAPSGPDQLAFAASRYEEWAQQSHDSRLLAGFYVVPAMDAPLWRYLPDTHRFEQIPWPQEWAAIRQHVSISSLPAPPFPPLLWQGQLLFVLPRVRPDGPPEVIGWGIAGFDFAYLQSEYVPHLVRKHLGDEYAQRYRVEVRGRRRPQPPIFGEPVDEPDAQAGLLPLRPGPMMGGAGRGLRPGLGPGPGAMMPGGPPPGPGEPGRPPHLWELRIQHKAGSLAQVVDQTRRWNIAISAGAMAVLVLSLGFLVISARRAERLAQLQLDFVAGVSHELRTPLAVIRSAGENLADGVTAEPSQVKRYGALVRDEGRRLSHLVEQVLSFARMQPGRAVERQPVDLREAAAQAAEACRAELAAAGATLECNYSTTRRVPGDSIALTHCIRNLLVNAARHGLPGGRVLLEVADKDGSVEIAVQDDGPGIDPRDLPHMFQPFYRGQRAKDSQTRGLGLGLTLVRRIAEAHGGKAGAANRPAGGARFWVRLPGEKS
jgi:signal transduction histidine kinase